MKPNEGRLQTAEHVLSHILEQRGAKVVIAKFKEDLGLLEVNSATDLRCLEAAQLQSQVNELAAKALAVKITIKERVDAEIEFDLTRLPLKVNEVRIVEIEGFDKTPCKDPHVHNTSEIGAFSILKIERVGKDRYRFVFRID
jgi:misacylated tRNA(Ala) deacylase